MKSQTSLTARNCRLQEWSQMVHSCNNRPIGMSVNEWCRENSITTANYYYRMTQVRKACLDSLSDEAVNQEVVPVPMNLVAPAEESCLNNPARRVGRGFRCSRQDFSHWDALEPRFSPELRFS